MSCKKTVPLIFTFSFSLTQDVTVDVVSWGFMALSTQLRSHCAFQVQLLYQWTWWGWWPKAGHNDVCLSSHATEFNTADYLAVIH